MALLTRSINDQARQANVLVRSRLKFNHIEARIFSLAVACINTNHTETPLLDIDVRDVLPGERSGYAYKQIDEATSQLMEKFASVESVKGKDKEFIKYSLFDSLSYNSKTGRVRGEFSKGIAPFLIQIKEQFTIVEIETLLTLPNAHAHRLYWILKSWESLGKKTMLFEDLRLQMLGDDCGDSYALYTQFRLHVLQPAIKAFEQLSPPWPVSFTEEKLGRKVNEIHFTIPTQAKPPKTPMVTEGTPKVKTKLTLDEMEVFRDWLRERSSTLVESYDRMRADYRLTEYQARVVARSITSEEELLLLLTTLKEVREAIRVKTPMKSVAAFTLGRLKEAFPTLFTKETK